MKGYYHYTLMKNVESIVKNGMYNNHPLFTTNEYYNAYEAGQALGVMPHYIDCVLLFKEDGFFKPFSQFIVPATGRFSGGGNQYQHHLKLKPVAKRKINEHFWSKI